jgi:hypothetical protein
MKVISIPFTLGDMKKWKVVLFALLCLSAGASFGQNAKAAVKSKSPYTIKGHVEGLHDTIVYLSLIHI